ncbi:MAG: glycoside hydrolase family 5 protein [Muribaculaceae bacterium]|nr:glycoside hydrolase family 5 protein [Muribaculaceae bacterium]
MNILKTIVALFCMMMSVMPMTACDSQTKLLPEEGEKPSTPTPGTTSDNEAINFALSMGMGWNLGNNLDAHADGVSNETCWGNPRATQKTFDAVKKAGFSCVRIPVSWIGHIGKGPEYHIEKAWLDRVAEVVGYAKNAGLKCIVNIHHDGFGAETNPAKQGYFWLDLAEAAKNEAKNEEIKKKLAMVWMQIANRFQNEDDWLIFETLNEIQDGKWGNGANLTDGGQQYRVLNEWNQTCVDIIRATGGKNKTRYIGVPGYVCQPGLTCDYLRIPDDETPNRILVAVHMYDPWDYAGSGKYSEWGHTGKDVVPDKSGEQAFTNTLNRLYNKFVRKGIPVYLGEYGCVHRNNTRAENFRKYYLEYTIKALRERKIPVIWWDNGNKKSGDDGFGLMEHDDGKIINNGAEIIKIMVDTWSNSDPNYTLQSIYDRAPQ